MIANERELLPPPECCRGCAHASIRCVNGVERSQCLRGHPMHPGGTWQAPRGNSSEGGGGVNPQDQNLRKPSA